MAHGKKTQYDDSLCALCFQSDGQTIVSGKLERLSESLVALDSKFGWLIQGTVSMLNVTSDTEPTDVGALHVSVDLDAQINHTLRSFWETESIGIVTERESKKR